ncbi:metal-dependent hydrolase [Cupriavidus basilensis]|jgi:hypothetical protein|uniref:metal-dependent hydrolase n=1 Tax=Cupriavidus TaxID=106589 RepID=UPI000450FC86|nr:MULTISPECIES: metal-dependent hydrolase [Cupriavidus]KDP84542.1 membrane protein [Cupriavidus sp. SK-3]MDF3887346.1 metal-dependent hydrolase [Cupriavidus basilensis]
MASSKAHHATGWAAGLIAAAVVTKTGAGGTFHFAAALAFLAGVAGGGAPDWLEVAWWSKSRRLWITHRTWTHWGIAWLALLAVAHRSLGLHWLAAPAFGFACGGLMHLLADWPNPLGVPWILGRHSLNWWKSGRCDLMVVAASWIGALALSRHVWFHGTHGLDLLHYLRAWHLRV